MGTPDIGKDSTGAIDFRTQRQLRCWKREDALPKRVKPVPITIILCILQQAYRTKCHDRQMIANIICVAFYYLLPPAEYTGTTADDQPFLMEDV